LVTCHAEKNRELAEGVLVVFYILRLNFIGLPHFLILSGVLYAELSGFFVIHVVVVLAR
jgi:hypothetical protein